MSAFYCNENTEERGGTPTGVDRFLPCELEWRIETINYLVDLFSRATTITTSCLVFHQSP